jgi:hypothetical protein
MTGWAVRRPPQRCVASLQESKQQKDQAHEQQDVHKRPGAIDPKDTEKPTREQDERRGEGHVASGRRNPDPP